MRLFRITHQHGAMTGDRNSELTEDGTHLLIEGEAGRGGPAGRQLANAPRDEPGVDRPSDAMGLQAESGALSALRSRRGSSATVSDHEAGAMRRANQNFGQKMAARADTRARHRPLKSTKRNSQMKGIVIDCLQEIVVGSFGPGQWSKILQATGRDTGAPFRLDDDLTDEDTLDLFGATCTATGLSFEQACDVFGAYWVGTYIPKRFPEFYDGIGSTRQFLLKLDEIHSAVRHRLQNATPPRHHYHWKDATTLEMTYESERDLMRLFLGALEGAAKHFGEKIKVRQLDRIRVAIEFPA